MKVRAGIVFACLFLLQGCQGPKSGAPGLMEYRCNGKKHFFIDLGADYREGSLPAKAVLHFEDQAVRLPRVESSAKLAYSDGLTTFRLGADGMATLATRDGKYENCRAD